jgi:cobalt-zinc-cadmium efflux system membrane fusion protein
VEKVDVLPGDRVLSGAPLVHIHSHELATAARDLATAEAEATYARAAYDRSARLLAMEAVSQEEVDRRLSQVSVAEAELQRSQEIVRHLSPSPDGQVVVRAPRGGTVFDVKVRPGEAVVVGTPLVDLGDASRLWVTGFLPENAVFGVSAGSLIAVTFDALPGTAISGRVVRIGGMVDSLRRAVEVRVQLDSVPAGVRPGMFAAMLVPAAAPAERVVLPAEAVQRINGGDAVFLAEQPGSYRMRPVKATELPDGRMAVEDLPAGVLLVVRGAYALKSQLESPAAGGE